MVFEERYGERVTCPHCETKGERFEDIPVTEGAYEEVSWQEGVCPHCSTLVLYKRVCDQAEVNSLWLADRTGEPLRRYVFLPQEGGRRVLWHMFVEDPLYSFLARQGFYDRFLQKVYNGKRVFGQTKASAQYSGRR